MEVKKSKRKYLSEYAVGLCSARWLMTSASQLMSGGETTQEQQEIIDNSHIYLICTRPHLSISKDSFKYEKGKISGHLNYKVNGDFREIPFCHDFSLVEGAVEVKVSKYPHRELSIWDNKGEEIRYLPAMALSMGLGVHLSKPELKNLEVLYIGQAFGDGTRSAFDRLQSHSTMQKILAQAQYESPDSEVLILTFEYVPYTIFSQFDGRSKNVIDDYGDLSRFRSIFENPLTQHQQICLVEAGLIRYFQPKYNEIYKINFPDKSHKILQSCYDLDFSGLIVEIDTEELRFSLYSDTIEPKEHHICQVDLLNPEKRWGFFYLTFDENNTIKMPNVIVGKNT